MKYAALILLVALTSAAAQNGSQETTERPVFRGLLQKYKAFQEINPTLENIGERPVFLSSFHPRAAARLIRYNEQTKEWEAGEWTRYCASTSGVTKPIEIKPGKSFRPAVYWQVSMNDWDKPTKFVTASGEERPINGWYKLSIDYAREPWILGNFPSIKYVTTSAEFLVEP